MAEHMRMSFSVMEWVSMYLGAASQLTLLERGKEGRDAREEEGEEEEGEEEEEREGEERGRTGEGEGEGEEGEGE